MRRTHNVDVQLKAADVRQTVERYPFRVRPVLPRKIRSQPRECGRSQADFENLDTVKCETHSGSQQITSGNTVFFSLLGERPNGIHSRSPRPLTSCLSSCAFAYRLVRGLIYNQLTFTNVTILHELEIILLQLSKQEVRIMEKIYLLIVNILFFSFFIPREQRNYDNTYF